MPSLSAVTAASPSWIRTAVLAAAALGGLSGCLGEPRIEDRWTRIDLLAPEAGTAMPAGTAVPVDVQADVYFRSLLTGAVVAEVRVTDNITARDLGLASDPSRLELLDAVNTLLANSTSTGLGVVPVTGWDHLIRGVDVSFSADIPADSGTGGVFLILYLADAEEVELPGGGKTLVITPFDFEATQVLPVVLDITPGA